jgi:hypothetical protein
LGGRHLRGCYYSFLKIFGQSSTRVFHAKRRGFHAKKVFLCVQNAKLKTYRLLSAKRIVKIMQISKETFSEERDIIGDGVRRPVLHLLEMF